MTPLPSDAAIAARLREILSGSEFVPPAQSRLDAWANELLHALGELLRPILQVIPGEVFVVLGATALLAAAGIALNAWLERSGTLLALPGGSAAVAQFRETDADPHALAAKARALAARGELRRAARMLHEALLRQCARHRGLAWDAPASDWEWVRALGGGEPLAAFTRAAEDVAFGPAPSVEAFEACAAMYEQLVVAEQAA